MYNKKQSANTYIRTLCSTGFSALTISFYKTNLTFRFIPYIGKGKNGLDDYNRNSFLSTSINYERAALFMAIAMGIIDGRDADKEIEAVYPCLNGTTLFFEYKPDQNNQMNAYLVINKNNETIPFRFSTHQVQIKDNGQIVTKVIQSGLGNFAMILEAYLQGVGADIHLNKLGDELEKYQLHDQQAFITTENNNQGYTN